MRHLILLYCLALAGSSFGCQFMICNNGTLQRCEKYKTIRTGVRLSTMYTEYYKDDPGCRKSLCCETGLPEAEVQKRGPGCIATKCVDTQLGNPCDVVDLRKSGRSMNIKLIDTYNETCRLPGKGKRNGLMSICCQPGHPERFLTVGYAAEKMEFPHQVRLSVGCGGTIYNERWIITAAHCVTIGGSPMNASDILLKAGTNIESNIDQIFQVEEVKVHEGFTELIANQAFLDNMSRVKFDIALLKLSKNIKFGKNAMALPLPPLDFNPLEYSNQGIIIGWGKADNYETPQLLRKSVVPLRHPTVCATVWRNPPFRFFSEQAVCLGGVIRNPDGTLDHASVAGQGDSGGPAICKDKDGFAVLCGITSYGSSDAACLLRRTERHCLPNVYSSVSFFRTWIEDIAGSQENATVYKVKLSGQKTSATKYPHQVKIQSSDESKLCGGTLISKDTVITSAHCVYKFDESGKAQQREHLKVLVQNKKNQSSFSVKKVYTKKWKKDFKVSNKLAFFNSPYRKTNFKILDDYYYNNDLAVLKLDGEVSKNVKPLKLPPAEFDVYENGVKVIETAWNDKTETFEKREVRLLTNSDCQHRFNAFNLRVMESNSPNFLSPEWNPVEAPNSNKTNTTEKLSSSSSLAADLNFDYEYSLSENTSDDNGSNSEESLTPFTLDEWNNLVEKLAFEKFGKVDTKGAMKHSTKHTAMPPILVEADPSADIVLNWLKSNMKDFKLSEKDLCYVENYSGGTTCDRELGGGIICTDNEGNDFLCGVQTFRLCFGSFPNIAVDVKQFRTEIISIINNNTL